MDDLTALALMKHRHELAQAAIDSEIARAYPREALRVRLARLLRRLAARLDGRGEHPGAPHSTFMA